VLGVPALAALVGDGVIAAAQRVCMDASLALAAIGTVAPEWTGLGDRTTGGTQPPLPTAGVAP
jgi:hypothetical protein